jgi:hypothetical protein
MFIINLTPDRKITSYRTGTLKEYNALIDKSDTVYIDRSHFDKTTYDVAYFINCWYTFSVNIYGQLEPTV